MSSVAALHSWAAVATAEAPPTPRRQPPGVLYVDARKSTGATLQLSNVAMPSVSYHMECELQVSKAPAAWRSVAWAWRVRALDLSLLGAREFRAEERDEARTPGGTAARAWAVPSC
jgi:hypothetical protein